MKRNLKLFAIAAVLGSAAFFLVGLGQVQKDREQFQIERAVRIARSVAWVAVQEEPEAAERGEPLQKYVESVAREVPGVSQVLVLRRVKYLAHSDPAMAGKRLDRDSLEDKALYDTAALLATRVRKNAEERERRPDMTRDAYQEFSIRELKGGELSLAVPVKKDGESEAMVSLRTRRLPAPARLPWGLLLIALGGIAVFVPLARLRHPAAVIGAGALVLAGLLSAQGWYLADWRADARLTRAHVEAQTYGDLAKAGLLEVADGQARESLVHTMGLTLDNRPRGDLVALERISDGQAAAPETVKVEDSGIRVLLATDWFAKEKSHDESNLAIWAGAIYFVMLVGFVLGVLGYLWRAWRGFVTHRAAYGYLSPAMLGMVVLVFIPVIFGLVLGFMQRRYNVFEFAGLSNYVSILSDLHVGNPANFYFKLGVTALWTFLNVGLHVSIGLFLALLLNDQMLKARGIFRVLLIVPWAVPNYITALIWKGMFHKQFGAVNFFLQAMGFEPISWFQHFWPAFTTNVVTNTWLGFPFMMVISLGALQSIPADLYEAARVDGAKRWQRFRYVTLPLLMPALVPAVIVGTVWTFNMFNIIYLVSGGAPNGATDILITDAFRWAFERDQYGYAAAYSTLIFVILLGFTLATNRITGATKGAFE